MYVAINAQGQIQNLEKGVTATVKYRSVAHLRVLIYTTFFPLFIKFGGQRCILSFWAEADTGFSGKKKVGGCPGNCY